jgi:Ca2+/Na+ antiporter
MNYVIGIVCINIVIGLIEKFFYPSTFLVILQTILAIIGIIIFYEEKKREKKQKGLALYLKLILFSFI